MYLRSTNVPRTIESLQMLLHGLYPPQHRSNSDPLHVHVRPASLESMYPEFSAKRCPSLVSFTAAVSHSLNHKHRIQTERALAPFSMLHFPDSMSSGKRAYAIYDVLASLKGNGLSFPPNIRHIHLKTLEEAIMNLWAGVYNHNENITRTAIGRFLPEMTSHLVQSQQGTQTNKIAIFSGHDSTLQPLLSALQIPQQEFPQYSSNVNLLFTSRLS